MARCSPPKFVTDVLHSWNWKCALLSATTRLVVYAAAIGHAGKYGGMQILVVELVYVTLTAGVYAGLQQRALQIRSRLLANLIVVLGVPGCAQIFDWLAHRAAGAAAPARATLSVCIFAAISALFHLHVMRRGAFLTGTAGRTLIDDFRRMPRLIVGFVVRPATLLFRLAPRATRRPESATTL